MSRGTLGWLGIVRLGLVQAALGAIVVLTTSTMNRVMVVELALPATIPGLLVGLHYAVQLLRPRLGYGSDLGGRRTPWMIGGMAVLGLGALGAALAIALYPASASGALLLALASFLLIGAGVGAAGTTLLVLMAKYVDPARRGVAATITWVMMICGFIVTAGIAGSLLDPYTPARLVTITAGVALVAWLVTVAALWGVEDGLRARASARRAAAGTAPKPDFRAALVDVWHEPVARRFTLFVFISMLAYSLQDLILEPFAGAMFGFTPGESTRLAGLQHAGVLAGMLSFALATLLPGGRSAARVRRWTVGGCLLSALALAALSLGALTAPAWPLRLIVFALGWANGAFAVAAISSMMALAATGAPGREGLRMGLWGAAQAVAFGLGGFLGTVAFDAARWALGEPAMAYAVVFGGEALLFVAGASLAARSAAADSVPPRRVAADMTQATELNQVQLAAARR